MHAHGMSAWQGVSIARVQSATVAVTAPVSEVYSFEVASRRTVFSAGCQSSPNSSPACHTLGKTAAGVILRLLLTICTLLLPCLHIFRCSAPRYIDAVHDRDHRSLPPDGARHLR